MKNKILFLLILTIGFGLTIFSCEEEERGPLVSDTTAPGTVSEVSVTNLPGGAKIEYKVPTDEDALLVEASYELASGRVVTTKSSIFKNFVIVEGLREVASQDVELVVVDRSNNRSQPVIVSISPETAPIDKFFTSLDLVEDFGGVRVVYNNEDNIKIELLLYAQDDKGNLIYSQSAFIEDDQRQHHTFRGFPPEVANFGVSAIDRWDNTTDILQQELTPLEEVLLNIEDFNDIFLTGDEGDAFGWVKTNMWNGTINGAGFHTAQGQPGTVVSPYTEGFHMFTMDLGVTAKLSRFKFWQRQGGWIFTHGNPRHFEVWGIDEIPADNGASLEGWTRLVENGEVLKPSGGPLGSNSAEDVAQAAEGEEFEFPIDAPPVRYIRFVNLESWSTGKFMHIMELNFWGQLEE
ncbi:DUF5000 domain-containing lipoprotein [Fulvivirgaceae bacterium BMA10]|uniref:DUF5000 domain-containing lipoprotein n=1 Tax=Splendidivirga corallicola TaxID=3051826 RepID=A0ABT8KP68_9BACT|nr:DUF5000 domain-containing lipoprotein [Fulvivirgaceae bacterium BMA10]